MKQTAVILGARGSMPMSGRQLIRYGGATTCVFLRLAGQIVVLDAGTGLMNLADVLEENEREIPVLLSHPHVDHLLGLALCPLVFDPSRRFDIYAARRGGLDAAAQLSALMSPPLWPVGPERLPAKFHFHDLSETFSIGELRVETMEGVHPGGVTLLRLSGGGRRVVFATDCTLTDALMPEVADFARDCDLLLIDGQYSEAEWPTRHTFGHSTWTAAARLGQASAAQRVRVIHHDPARTDRELDEAAAELRAIHPDCSFAWAGEEITL